MNVEIISTVVFAVANLAVGFVYAISMLKGNNPFGGFGQGTPNG